MSEQNIEAPQPVRLVVRGEPQPLDLDLDQAAAWLATLAGASVVVDVETSGYPVGHPAYRLRTVQLGVEAWALVLDADDPAQQTLARDCLAAAAEVVAHSPTADLVPLELAGIVDGEVWERTTDTAVLAALADPGYRVPGEDSLGLKTLSRHNLDHPTAPDADQARKARFRTGKWLTNTDALTPPERNGWAQVPAGDPAMTVYAASDVLDTAALARVLPRPPETLLARERALLAITSRAARRGLRLDPDALTELRDQTRGRAEAAAGWLADVAGITEPSRTGLLGERLAALGAPLPLTATGKPSTARGALEDLAEDPDTPAGQAAVMLLEWRSATKLLSAFLDPWSLQVEHGDGRIRTTIYTLGAVATGRMSSARVNLQQVPRKGGVRACITADPGSVLISADFSSVEVRVAAALSQDPTLRRLVETGGDLHSMVAERWRGPGFTSEHRSMAKRAVFGRLYGSGPGGIARSLGVSPSDAQGIVDALDAVTPTLGRWSRDLSRAVKDRLTLWHELPSGRRVWYDTDRAYAAGNYQIQSTARELLADALLRWETGPWAGETVVPVHDELVVVVPEADAAAATEHLVACMTTTLHGVPITAEASEPSHAWSDH